MRKTKLKQGEIKDLLTDILKSQDPDIIKKVAQEYQISIPTVYNVLYGKKAYSDLKHNLLRLETVKHYKILKKRQRKKLSVEDIVNLLNDVLNSSNLEGDLHNILNKYNISYPTFSNIIRAQKGYDFLENSTLRIQALEKLYAELPRTRDYEEIAEQVYQAVLNTSTFQEYSQLHKRFNISSVTFRHILTASKGFSNYKDDINRKQAFFHYLVLKRIGYSYEKVIEIRNLVELKGPASEEYFQYQKLMDCPIFTYEDISKFYDLAKTIGKISVLIDEDFANRLLRRKGE